jgi:GGDEF domain-containing protein
MNRDQFFIDEEPLPPGTQVGRIASYFNKTGIQSLSFENGLGKNEIKTFLDILTSSDTYPNADEMRKALAARGVRHVKINHVFFKKVTRDDEIISNEALEKLTPKIAEQDEKESRRLFIDMVLERLLAEELKETLTIENLLKDPAALSNKMTETDVAFNNRGEVKGGHPGMVLMHELEILGEDLQKHLDDKTGLPEIARALSQMKQRLVQCMDAQKYLKVNYTDEKMILEKVDEITDCVLLRIVTDEYKDGKTPISRLAQILRRLVPEAAELKRLLPKIRATLLEKGMTLSEYFHLLQELGNELESEELAVILKESSEEIGLDGEILIEEIKKNPVQAAELIYLAAEIRKGHGDEHALSDLLVDYVERIGSKLTTDFNKDGKADGEQHLRQVLTSIESGIVVRLKGMDFKDDLLERLEEKLSSRIDAILERIKLDWINSHTDKGKDERTQLSVLELLEQSVADGDELSEILEIIREKVSAGEIDKDNFTQIYAEITKQEACNAQEMRERMPKGILEEPAMTVLIAKEIGRAKRYNTPFSALAFSLVKAVVKQSEKREKISYRRLLAAVFQAVSNLAREPDVVGQLGKGGIAVILPMTSGNNAQQALRRLLKKLHACPVTVDGTTIEIRLAGVAVTWDSIRTPDSDSFIKTMMNELVQMQRRIKNLQTYM